MIFFKPYVVDDMYVYINNRIEQSIVGKIFFSLKIFFLQLRIFKLIFINMENILNNLMNDKEIIEELNKKFGDSLIIDSNGSIVKKVSKTKNDPLKLSTTIEQRMPSVFSPWAEGTSSDANLYNSIWYNTIVQCKKGLEEDQAKKQASENQDLSTNVKPDIKIHYGERYTEEEITFQAYLVEVESEIEIEFVFDQLKQDFIFANATNNFYAYRIVDNESNICEYCDTDGDSEIATKLLEQLQESDIKNILIIVSIWHLEEKFESDKYKHIKHVTNEILLKCDKIKK